MGEGCIVWKEFCPAEVSHPQQASDFWCVFRVVQSKDCFYSEVAWVNAFITEGVSKELQWPLVVLSFAAISGESFFAKSSEYREVVLLVWSEAKDVVTDVDGSLDPCKCLTNFFPEYLTCGVDTKKKVFYICTGPGVLQRWLYISGFFS